MELLIIANDYIFFLGTSPFLSYYFKQFGMCNGQNEGLLKGAHIVRSHHILLLNGGDDRS